MRVYSFFYYSDLVQEDAWKMRSKVNEKKKKKGKQARQVG